MNALTSPRQRRRWSLILISFFLFPVTLNFFSPYLIVLGAFGGVVAGSALLFVALFVSGMVLGRGFCAWVCPGAGLQEACYPAMARRTPHGPVRVVKYVIWSVWLAAIVMGFLTSSGPVSIRPLYHTPMGVSTDDLDSLMRYLAIAGSILAMGLFVSRRSFCHTLCWMAPFLVLGQKVGRWLRVPQLGLVAVADSCNDCDRCTRSCPMDLPVDQLVKAGDMHHPDCILCGQCVDACRPAAVVFSWRR